MTIESGGKPALHKKHIARLERERRQSRIILYTFLGILVAVLLLLGYGFLDIKYFQLQKPVAKVGDVEILAKEFEARVKMQRQQLLGQYNQYAQYGQLFGMDVQQQLDQIKAQLDAPETVGQSVLDQMINEQLVRLEAKKRGITVSEAEINEKIQGEFGYYPNGTPTPAATPTQNPLLELPPITPSPTTVPTATATPEVTATPEQPTAIPSPMPTATPYTLEGFQKAYKEANDSFTKLGFDYDVFHTFYENQLLRSKLQEVISADAKPTEEQVRARHILVADEALAKELIKRLQNGENFAALAMEYSSDTGSASKGGDLGWFGKDAMVAEFEAAAYALEKPGDFTTTPVKSQFGYHIIQLIDRPYSPEQIEAAKDQAFSDWLTKAREEYGVETFDIWKNFVPTEPNFVTAATEAANAQNTALAEEAKATATPAP
jgi:peptidyl-prolyl cis-trans isomerase D